VYRCSKMKATDNKRAAPKSPIPWLRERNTA
jgi:hypothetical protein